MKRVSSKSTPAWNVIIVLSLMTACGVHQGVEGKDITPTQEIKPPKYCDFQDPDVKYFDFKLSPTEIPANLTTYVCQVRQIPIPLNTQFHAIGFLPLLSNKAIVHHMILFGCANQYAKDDVHYCSGLDNTCRHFMVQWSRGLEGPICSHPDAGVKFGVGSMKWLSLQIHWNNEYNTPGLQDESGFRIFYTSKLRQYDLSNVQIGQNDLEIPALNPHVAQSGSCSPDCTRSWLTHPIYLTRAHIHMHYTGSGGSIHIIRGGTSEVVEVVNDPMYDYDKPPAHSFDKPVKVLPGDEIKVTCIFNTRDGQRRRNETLYFGEGSDGEMCYAFVTYYPMIQNFDQCIQFDQYDICTRDGLAPLGECIFPGFVYVFHGMADEILKQCSPNQLKNHNQEGIPKEILCSASCKSAISEVTDHACMQGRLRNKAELSYLPQVATWPEVKSIMDEAANACNVK